MLWRIAIIAAAIYLLWRIFAPKIAASQKPKADAGGAEQLIYCPECDSYVSNKTPCGHKIPPRE